MYNLHWKICKKNVSTQIKKVHGEPTWYIAENKELPDRDTDLPSVRKYANYRTLVYVDN